MNKVLFIVSLSVMIALIFAPIFTDGEEKIEEIEYVEVHIETEAEIETEENYRERIINEMQSEMESINDIEDKKEWFIAYKEIVDKYSDTLDPPETIYDVFIRTGTKYEEQDTETLELLFRVVEAEAEEGNFLEKANVASVIFNRLHHGEFGNTLTDILSRKQFSSISDGRYLNVEITEDTILGCEYAFAIKDTTNGALFFEKETNIHSSYADYLFTDNIGHNFYAEKEK